MDQLSPETMEAVLLLAYGDAVIVKSKVAAERVREAVDHIGLTAWIETRRLNDLSDREKDALASDIRRAKEFQRKIVSGEKETSRLMEDFLRSRSAPVATGEKSRLPPYLPTISIRITDPKLLLAVKDRERAAAAPEILQRVVPTLGARKCYDTLPSNTSPGKDAAAVAKVEGISPPGKSAILRKILGPVSERMETDYKEALKKETNSANFVEFSPEGGSGRKPATAEEQDDGLYAGAHSLLATCNEDSGIEGSRPTSPDFEDSVEEESVEVIDERTHVRYNTSADGDGELASKDEIEAEKESDAVVANEKKSEDTEDLRKNEKVAAEGKLDEGKGGKRRSADKIGASCDRKKLRESRTDGEKGVQRNTVKSSSPGNVHKFSKFLDPYR